MGIGTEPDTQLGRLKPASARATSRSLPDADTGAQARRRCRAGHDAAGRAPNLRGPSHNRRFTPSSVLTVVAVCIFAVAFIAVAVLMVMNMVGATG